MPIPILAYAGMALAGAAITYFVGESDKKVLRKAHQDLEASHAELQRELSRAASREVRARKERMGLMLRYYQARLETLLAEPDADLVRLARLSATASQLAVVAGRLSAAGEPNAEDVPFLNIVGVAMAAAEGGRTLTKVEVMQLDDYLEQQQPGALARFLQSRFAQMFEEKAAALEMRGKEIHALKIEYAAARALMEVEGPTAVEQAKVDMLRAKLEQGPADTKRLQKEVDDIRFILVVVTRLGAADRQPSPHDADVERILGRKLDGSALTQQEEAFLDAYQRTYFGEVRTRLKRAGIELVPAARSVAS